jgi:Ca-activated chloride channel family protein
MKTSYSSLSRFPSKWKLYSLLMLLFLSYVPPVLAFEWVDLWLTPDQQAQRLMNQGAFGEAAKKFSTAPQIGTALFRAGEFQKAASVFGRSVSPEADYNRGNAHIMLGEYDTAIEDYKKALSKRPEWLEAQQNLEVAILRKRALAPPDDDFGGTGGMLEADEIVFDLTGKGNNSNNDEIIDAGDQTLDQDSMRAMWLRKVETRPADFLAARFSYQLATRDNPPTEDSSETTDVNGGD